MALRSSVGNGSVSECRGWTLGGIARPPNSCIDAALNHRRYPLLRPSGEGDASAHETFDGCRPVAEFSANDVLADAEAFAVDAGRAVAFGLVQYPLDGKAKRAFREPVLCDDCRAFVGSALRGIG